MHPSRDVRRSVRWIRETSARTELGAFAGICRKPKTHASLLKDWSRRLKVQTTSQNQRSVALLATSESTHCARRIDPGCSHRTRLLEAKKGGGQAGQPSFPGARNRPAPTAPASRWTEGV